LVAARISGTALVAGEDSVEFDCFLQPATNKTEAAKLRRMALLTAVIYWLLTVMLLSTDVTP
jgi:hypothetical protein